MTTAAPTASVPGQAPGILSRIIAEGYGTGAWHGPDMAAALSDVTAALAFRRPASGRHNIAEIALHHAAVIRAVTGQLAGRTPDPFPLEGEDWFEADGKKGPSWEKIRAILADYQGKLAHLVAEIEAGRATSPLAEPERLGLVLGVTCHAVYHAGQIQLVKRLVV